ncbi:MAG: DegQ family serine endoprotease [Telmatospirillum sp.]|nr:DegQ family serine endoprotease [Telmatospirillum sp.]
MQWLLAGLVGLTVMAMAMTARAAPAPDSFADLAERLLPSVVNISTTQTLKNADRGLDMPQFPPGSPFEDFFKNFMDKHGGNNPDAAPRRATALGSGFIIDPNGLVVTNNHVIADADEITVILQDGQAYKADIVGRDAKADLALLKITTPNKLPAISFGNSDEMRVGDWVIAIGNPFGMAGTVTAGIISARGRDINAGPYDDFLQTDAAINKGNSGGPLINLKGEVIGINTAILGPTGGSVGIGFSIPANLAKPVITDLQKYGKPRRGWLGVKIQSVTDEIAESLGLKDQRGALIADVSAGGPAAKAGLKKGDVISKFDGKDVTEMHRLPRIVAETPINKDVEVLLWRDGKQMTLHAVVGELNDAEDAEPAKANEKPSPKTDGGQTNVASLGLSVSQLSPALREKFDIGADVKGVVVTDVKQSGPAAEKGMRPGDVIVEVSQEAIKSPADFAGKIDAARKSGRKSVLLLVQSEAGVHFVPLKIETPTGKKDGGQ